jgi:ATP-binding cassette, subfamily B, bacterial
MQPASLAGRVEPADLPEAWKALVGRTITAGERLLAWVVSDVDSERQYKETLLLLTDRRFLAIPATQQPVQSWPIEEVVRLASRDRSGLGQLEVLGADRLLARFHYTLGLGPAILVLLDRLEEMRSGEVAAVRDDGEVPEPQRQETRPSTMALFRLWQFAKPHWKLLLLGIGLSLASTAASLLPLYLTAPILNEILIPYESALAAGNAEAAKGQFALAPWYLGGFLLAAVLAWILGWAQGAILAFVSERVTADLRLTTYAHLQRLSLEYFGAKRTGDLMSRINTDSDRLCNFLSDSVVDFFADCLLIVGVTVMVLALDPSFAMVILLPFPFIAWTMYLTRDKLQTGFQTGGRAWANMTSVLADTIPGIRVVKAFAQESREIERFSVANRQVVVANDRVNSVWTFFWPMIVFLNQVGVLIVWAFGIYRVYLQQLDVGTLAAFLALTARFYGRLESMSRMVNASQRAAASAQRIFEVLDHVSTVPEPAKPVPLAKVRGEVELRNVGFRYGNRKVIHDLNLKIAPGEMIGLVGHTGAGKSTLINLVCRFFDVAEGAILVDGVDIRSYPIEQFRRNVGLVLQDPFLFYGTIAENISYGRPEATRAEIIAAAKAARAHDFILGLPDGYDSLVGERGQSLSGGERQRVSIARALLIDPQILILDEATSAIDTQTERQIQEALENLVKGRTTIAIAHRLSTLSKANRIVVLDRGKIVEAGTHEELLAINGVYAGLHRAQRQLTADIGW